MSTTVQPCVYTEDIDGQIPSFNERRDGFWRCDEDTDPKWCKHLAKMMAENIDAPCWPNIFRDFEDGEFVVQVPIMPTIAVFTEVHLIPTTVGNGKIPNAAEVVLMKGTDISLGYMTEGDATSTLRWMLFDWFTGQMDVIGSKCRMATHKAAAEAKWQADMKRANSKLGQLYCVWETGGKCMYCQGGYNDQFDDDLIPDPGQSRSPWR